LTAPQDQARASTNSSKVPDLINLIDEELPSQQNHKNNLASFSSLTPDRSSEALVRPNSLPATLPSSMADVRLLHGDDGTGHRSQDVLPDAIHSESDDMSEIYHRTGYGDMIQDQSGFDFEEETWPMVGR
jgi:hypothetical protein